MLASCKAEGGGRKQNLGKAMRKCVNREGEKERTSRGKKLKKKMGGDG